MQIKSAQFDVSAPELAACPPASLPEFAFIGRSNVGKSSLLNLLTSRKDLAKVSATPGHTRLINFFTINGTWRLVDLPGYGYAKTAKANTKQFEDMVASYFADRAGISGVLVLIDSRHSPQQIDLEFVTWLAELGRPFALIFTKADKVKPNQQKRNVAEFVERIGEAGIVPAAVFATSTKTGSGRSEVLRWVAGIAGGSAR